MEVKKLIYKKIWIFGIVLLICSVLTLSSFYFISNVAQNIYYGIYVILSIITIVIIHKKKSLSIHHSILIFFNLFLIYITYVTFVAVPVFFIFPFLLIFPLFHSKKSHRVFKFFSTLSYLLLLVIMVAFVFVRLIFTSVKIVATVDSPNNKQIIQVYSIDNGAVGGSTQVYIAEKYCNLFKKSKFIYYGHYGEGNDIVKWIDNNHVQIDSKIIDITEQ